MKITKKLLVLLVVILMSVMTMNNQQCYAKSYSTDSGKNYTFKGKVKKITYYHSNGQKLKGYRIYLPKKIKIKSSFWGGTFKVKQLQVIPKSKKQERKIKKKLGKKITVRGMLVDGMTAWYSDQFAVINAKINK